MAEKRFDLSQAGYGTRLFNSGWEFAKLPLDTQKGEIDSLSGRFADVDLPHDWLIYQGQDLDENSSGWYRKYIVRDRADKRKVLLRFEGIYMDSTVYVNGAQAACWKYGYSTFEADITPYLIEGTNEILVQVLHQAPNSRWYSGAGIYRNVWLKVLHPEAHLVSDGTYVTVRKEAEGRWILEARTEVSLETGSSICRSQGNGHDCGPWKAAYALWDMQTGQYKPFADADGIADVTVRDEEAAASVPVQDEKTAAAATAQDGEMAAVVPGQAVEANAAAVFQAVVENPSVWDTDCPSRYRLKVRLQKDGEIWQEEAYTVGFRQIAFSPDQGFLLNGRKVKLNGVCEHHDLGCLGAAYHTSAMRRKLKILRRMGVNALRLTHNMPSPDVMELADEMGFLIVSEAFDMWERPKNPYDYARFFREWYQKDVASWVRRDRNHPSLIMWSIGNEIYDTHADDRGQEITRLLSREVRKHDPDAHAGITIGSNYMPWENARKCADIVKLAGYNYAEKYYDSHHREHPDWVIYGSETSSTVQSRGVYHFPYEQPVLADEDEQCSALGNSTTSWGAKSSESCIIAERDHEYSCGQFLWTGFDYIGEPTPYHTRNSYFGQIDTAGFPKDSYYIYQAEWTDYRKAPMVHVFPYWDFNEGQMIGVRVCSNAPKVELFLNGESQGTYDIDHKHGMQFLGHWRIPYTPGVLLARAYDEKGRTVAEEKRSSFGEASEIVLDTDCHTIKGNGQELAFIEITARDAKGNPVENASARIHVRVSGAGRLVGMDNGDSTDTDEYKTDSRRMFNGKLLAVIAGTGRGTAVIEAFSKGLKPARLELQAEDAPVPEGFGREAYGIETETAGGEVSGTETLETKEKPCENDEIPVRAIRLFSSGGLVLNEDQRTAVVTASLCPSDASDREVCWRVVNEAGIPSSIAAIEAEGLQAKLTANSGGRFRLRCMSKSGTDHIRILSELDFEVTGIEKAWLDPYGFISGGLYDYSKGEPGNGNEHGVATARDGETQVGYHGIDFGDFGSDVITLPIFALDDKEYPIQIWEGMPGEEGSSMIGEVVYQKPSKWNVYQEETYRLNRRLAGITSICFVLHQKIHLKGFSFKRLAKAYEKLLASECSAIYGDSFERTDTGIDHIGNNVTLRFEGMDFGTEGTESLIVCGYTPMEKNTIQVRFESEEGERIQLLEFMHRDEVSEQVFKIKKTAGCRSVSFVFLPGSNFDFKWFRFVQNI